MKKILDFKYLRGDLLSGFIVSLIALPLCLGVASASNFPPITGVLTAIIGGLVIGFISGSELAIKGPAAGLIVIVAGAVEEFGKGNAQLGYILTASLIAVTGLMQVILGILKVGRWADFIPSSIVHGMLAAIGIIIISKQIHLLIGITPEELKGKEPLDLILEVPRSLFNMEWQIAVIGVCSLVLLFLLPRVRNPIVKAIPSFLIVIVFAVFLSLGIQVISPNFNFYNARIHPGAISFKFLFDSRIFNDDNITIAFKYFFLLTIIGTIESVLTVKAVDLLDPRKRVSNHNKDIIAIGVGNILAGLMGALPMISEVARSSANINNKGVTKLATIAHGVFLSIFVIIFVSIITLIPVAALSSILIFVGYKLANPNDFLKAIKISNEHFFVFLTTLVITIVKDILVGVACGIVLKIIINFIKSGELRNLFFAKITVEKTDRQAIFHLNSVAVFTNWLAIKKAMQREHGKKIVVDFSEVKVVDSSFIDNIMRFKENYKDEFILRGLQEMRPIKNHPHSMRIKSLDGEVLTIQLSPYQRKLRSFCEENSFIVSFNTVIPRNYFSSFKSFKHVDIKLAEVYVIGMIDGVKFEYLEGLMYDPVDMLEYYVNILGIDFDDITIPKFRMQRESKLDTVIEFLVKNQVVFENHSEFNSMYSIYSREKEAINSIFTEPVISFFEENDLQDNIIEGNGEKKIIIYNNGRDHVVQAVTFKLKIAAILKHVS